MPRLTSFSQSSFAGLGITRSVPSFEKVFTFHSTGFEDKLLMQSLPNNLSMTQVSTTANLGYQAYGYTGAGPYFDISSETSQFTAWDDAITVEGWVYLNANPSALRHVFGIHSFVSTQGSFTTDNSVHVQISNTNYLALKTNIQGSGSTVAISGMSGAGAISTGQWHHVGFSLFGFNNGANNTYAMCYLNGVTKSATQAVGVAKQFNMSDFIYFTSGRWYDWNSLEQSGENDYGVSQVRVYTGLPSYITATDGSQTSYTVPTASW